MLKDYVQVCLEEHHPLKEAVTEYLGVYRCTLHATTGQKPAVLLHGRHPSTRLDLAAGPTGSILEVEGVALQAVKQRVTRKQLASKHFTDRRRAAKP